MPKVTNAQLKTIVENNADITNANFLKAKQEVNALDVKIDGLTASDVGALADTVKYGRTLELSMNSETFVITAQLKDQDGNLLGTAQTIDLPLESVVVSGSYNSQTKKVVLTLKDGSTVDFSVADLISGLQSEITSTNKLDADLVDDTNAANKFVTAAEKTKIAEVDGKTTMAAVEAKGYQTADDVNTALNDVLAGISITAWDDIVISA